MSLCDQVQRWLPEFVAAGEPPLSTYAPLLRHLNECPACQAYAADLRVVEGALHDRPIAMPSPNMAPEIMAMISHEEESASEERLLTWDVWVPVLALGLALLITLMAVPVALPSDAPSIGVSLTTWIASLSETVKKDLFWAIWSGVFVTTAGLGISLALGAWDEGNSRRLSHLEQDAMEIMDRLWTRARRAH
ncbi:MAG TPA: zf-HC2 domain-containing protein [Chloroflexi bacterium]|jgi:predicted anti-sigma-YlaC factor YlaD|nr:zf-HC2 domain-containing protein [Chloroflexota bacterium]